MQTRYTNAPALHRAILTAAAIAPSKYDSSPRADYDYAKAYAATRDFPYGYGPESCNEGEAWHGVTAMQAAACSEISYHLPDQYRTFKMARLADGGAPSFKLQYTRERLTEFAAEVARAPRLFGGGKVDTGKAKKAPSVWSAGAAKLVIEAMESRDYTGALSLAQEKCGPLFYDHGEGPFMLVCPEPVEFSESFFVARHEKGHYSVFEVGSGHSVGNRFKTVRSKGAAIARAANDWQNLFCEDEKANALLRCKVIAQDQTAMRAAWMAAHDITDIDAMEQRADTVNQEQAAQALEYLQAMAADNVDCEATQAQEVRELETVGACETTSEATTQASAAPGMGAAIAQAGRDLERITASWNYDHGRRALIDLAKGGNMQNPDAVASTLQRIADHPGHAIEQIEARKALAALQAAKPTPPRALARRTLRGNSTSWSAQLETNATGLFALRFTCADGSTDKSEHTTRSRRAQHLRELVRLNADDVAGHDDTSERTPGARSVAGADGWIAELSTDDGLYVLEFTSKAGGWTPTTTHATRRERAQVLRVRIFNDKGCAWLPVNVRGVDADTPHDAQSLTDAQYRAAVATLEETNNHGAVVLLGALRTGNHAFIYQARAINAQHHADGCLSPDLQQQRSELAHRVRAWLENTQATPVDNAPAPCPAPTVDNQEPATTTQAAPVADADYTAPRETSETDELHDSPRDLAPAFQKMAPVAVDLGAVLAKGAPAQGLVGMGVQYLGDADNLPQEGAIVAAWLDAAAGVLVEVTTEDGAQHGPLLAQAFQGAGRWRLTLKMHGAPYLAQLATAQAMATRGSTGGAIMPAMTYPEHMTGAELQTLREGCGLDRDEFAGLADVQARTVKHWENGRAGVPADVAQLARELDAACTQGAAAMLQRVQFEDVGAPEGQPVVLVRYKTPQDMPQGQNMPAGLQGAMVARVRLELLRKGRAVRVVWHDADQCDALAQLQAQALPHRGDQPATH